MTKTAFTGPIIAFGQRLPLGNLGPINPDLGPSLFWGGVGLLDLRLGYNTTRRGAIGWLGSSDIPVLDIVPATISAVNIAASQVPVAATPLTLVAATGAGITVLAAAQVVWPAGNSVPINALAIDGPVAVVGFGTADLSNGYTMVSLYDPTSMCSRAVRVTSVGNDSVATATVAGFDVYGYPMSETITLANAGIATGKKAFKYVTSIIPAGTLSGSAVTVGTADIIGFPIRTDTFGDTAIVFNNTWTTANTGYVAAITTSPSTPLLGDVRGTYALQSASDGTKRLQVFVTPKVANIGTAVGLFGVTPA